MTAIPPGGNAEDCPSCDPTDPAVAVYPWICPGHPEPVAVTAPEPLDLAAIRADQITATTSPVRPGITAAEVDAWNEAVEQQAAANRELRATVYRLTARLGEQVAENRAVRGIVANWLGDANDGHGSDPGDLAWALEQHDAEHRAEEHPPPLPTTEDYRVVLRDETSVDEPHGGWQLASNAQPTLAAAVRRLDARRRNWPDSPEMRVWRRQQVWSVVAVETRDASRAPESPADAPDPSGGPERTPERS